MMEVTMKRTAKQAMDVHVLKLRAAGWRVRNGGWPSTRAAARRWDFCRTKDTLFAMTPAANEAARQAAA
jgi:hypothetical protein